MTSKLRLAWTAVLLILTAAVPLPLLAQEQGGSSEPPRQQIQGPAVRAEKDPFAGVEVMEVVGSSSAMLLDAANPGSVISFDSADLEAIGATDVADVAAYTPNLEVRTAGSTTAVFFIRGVGLADFSSNASSSVAVYNDGVPMNSSALQLGQLFDIQDFSVLKGPQSGGSGRNASAGAIRITSREPGFQHAGNLRVSVGRFLTVDAIDAPQYDVEGGVDTPIVEDVLTSRIAFTVKGQEPYITNRCGGAPFFFDRERDRRGNVLPYCGENLGSRSFRRFPVPEGLPTEVGQRTDVAGRMILKLTPPDSESEFILNLHGRRLRQDSTLGEAIGTGADGTRFGLETAAGYQSPETAAEFDAIRRLSPRPPNPTEILAKNLAQDRPLDKRPFSGDYNRVGGTRLESYGGAFKASGMVGDVSLRSITGIDAYSRWRSTDNDFTPDVLFESTVSDNAWQVAQELRVEGSLDDYPLQWEFGGNYLYEDLYQRVDQDVGFPFPTGFDRTFSQEIHSVAVYARTTIDFLEDFTLEAGVRYNWEQKQFDILQFGNTPIPRRQDEVRTWQAPTGAISLTYHVTESLRAYWKYSRGFKAGHFNSNKVPASPASPEKIDAFEIGLEGSFWAERLRLAMAFFNYAYEDYQVFVFQDETFNPPSLVVRNADDARVYGADAELALQPLIAYVPEEVENLSLKVRFGWLETRFLRFVQLQPRTSNFGPFTVVEDNSGNPTINSPRFKVSGTLDWKLILGPMLGSLTPRYDVTFTDDIFFDPAEGRGSLNALGERGNPKFRTGQPAYVIHNIRLTYRDPEEKIAITGWCRNLTDTRYKTAAFDLSAFSKVTLNFVGDPRSCGGEISLRW